jgi:hypothetical protein
VLELKDWFGEEETIGFVIRWVAKEYVFGRSGGESLYTPIVERLGYQRLHNT